ncbi:hypothetical protein ACOXXX_06360 [Thalassococcus sp. BH17M4-6]|uniref:hypothetical protein n=1 Tax=Thalassococcus sp. BH17M4-6 TaxID=3413148 RepID=UPI003BC7CDE0
MALALCISRSTLQRRLRAAGTSYQAALDATRRDMAFRDLTKTTLRADEIANVLLGELRKAQVEPILR